MRLLITALFVGALVATPALAQSQPEAAPGPWWTIDKSIVGLGVGYVGSSKGVTIISYRLASVQRLHIGNLTLMAQQEVNLLAGSGTWKEASGTVTTYDSEIVGIGIAAKLLAGWKVIAPDKIKGGFEVTPFLGAFYELGLSLSPVQVGAYGLAAGGQGWYWTGRSAGTRQFGIGLQLNVDGNFSGYGNVVYPSAQLLLCLR